MSAARKGLAAHASYALAALADRTSQLATRLADFSEGFALSALEAEARTTLTAWLYARSPYGQRRTLFTWEEAWLPRALPPAPAHLLVGGAGHGREADQLMQRGYRVTAFDARPSASGLTLRYEQLAPALRGTGPREVIDAARVLQAAAPFDAVLLGWLSLSHVAEPRDQDALFAALDCLAPRAPILASFWTTDMRRTHTGKAHALGAALGARLRDARAATLRTDADLLRCLPHTGFVYLFDRPRLEALARSIGRTLELDETADCPHATFAVR